MSDSTVLQQYASHVSKVAEILEPLSSNYGINHLFYVELFPEKEEAFFLSNQHVLVEKVINIGRFSKDHEDSVHKTDDGGYKFVWSQTPPPSMKLELC